MDDQLIPLLRPTTIDLAHEFRLFVGRATEFTFGAGEQRLLHWLKQHTGISWMLHSHPWELKPVIFKQYFLPLNIIKIMIIRLVRRSDMIKQGRLLENLLRKIDCSIKEPKSTTLDYYR